MEIKIDDKYTLGFVVSLEDQEVTLKSDGESYTFTVSEEESAILDAMNIEEEPLFLLFDKETLTLKPMDETEGVEI